MFAAVIMPGAIAILFALVHISGYKLSFLRVTPRSIWLSAAGGVSVAYVFVQLLPELARFQQTVAERTASWGILSRLEHHLYIVALVGLGLFYGVERAARTSARGTDGGAECRPSGAVFWIHLGAFAVYNFLIGYLLVHQEDRDLQSLIIFGFAMAVHFIVNDHALREHHGDLYDRKGRWLLACAPVFGWAIGLATEVSSVLIATIFAFLAGGVVLNVLKEELPEERESRFLAFASGSAAYAALLLIAA